MSEEVKRCVFCHETEAAIRKHGLFCAGVDSYTGECTWERDRHRFKPFTEKELEAMAEEEEYIANQMGEFADFVESQGCW